ncbi:symmetrical bis(5'-nucleosyl)-tetraphosphatase [Corallincola platygyrae]|uniref:bis(5'-nucleosyl)-tetraphosphatase (symmetrical) n=1 Tax=Corallincola platygyrae TaxID=1193278 RepID=A0ABW4XL68_9GAMM
MATYIVGDIQGCFDELDALLRQVEFDSKTDQLWLTGDLVARGAKSLETLRFVKSLGDSAITVLGNHDLHLLACAEGFAKVKDKDQLANLMNAPDRDELLHWLRHQPLFKRHPDHRFVMTHAGIPPQWSVDSAEKAARKVEKKLRGNEYRKLLRNMYGNGPSLWSENLSKEESLRFTINALTRMRFVYRQDLSLEMQCKTAPENNDNSELVPWFNCRSQHSDPPLVFGHWASLLGNTGNDTIHALDTGCVWGNNLTALCWETQTRHSLPCTLPTK